jgi:arylsulfatase A-like enzyme
MKKTFLCLAAVAVAAIAAIPSIQAAEDRPPNVVFVFADDLGIGDLGVYGSEVIETPNIDAMAAAGVRFSQGYVSHPVCSPSRAGLLTGRYQQRHGWEFNPAGRDPNAGMSADEETFADAMRERGYATGMVGKWHLGYKGPHHPMSRGFDEYFGVLAGGSIFIDTSLPGVESIGNRAPTRQFPHEVYAGKETVVVEEYLTDRFTTEAVEFIDRHKDEPFLLYLSHTTPHTPLQATKQYLDRYRHIEDKGTRIYAAMVSSLDDSVGAVITKLKEIGQYENTLLVFLSDNGCAGYINGACSNGPHAGFKRYHQEGGIRVPFIMSWPAAIPAGQVYDHPVISLDLLATFTGAAGDAQTTEDSVNLLPYVTGKQSGAPHEYLYWRAGPTKAIRDDRWKLIQYKRSPLTRADLRADGRLEPPSDGWPKDAPDGYVTLLYDLSADPGETANLAGSKPEIVNRLAEEHARWDAGLTDEQILPAVRSTLAEMDGETVQLIF